MSSILCRRLISKRVCSLFSPFTEISSIPNVRLIHRSRSMFSPDNPNDENPNPPPMVTQPAVLDKYLVPATVMATGAMLAPGIIAMAAKPVNLWFYRRYYDWGFDAKQFLVGARRALYFVAEKAVTKDFYGLKDVVTPEAMNQIREMVRDESFRFYINLRAPSTPVLYEKIGAAGFLDDEDQSGREDEHVQFYGRSSETETIPERRFEILVFFVCKIERLLGAAKDGAVIERPERGVKNYCRLLVMMTFSRLLERRQEQTSDWLVSSLALVPLQFSFARRADDQ